MAPYDLKTDSSDIPWSPFPHPTSTHPLLPNQPPPAQIAPWGAIQGCFLDFLVLYYLNATFADPCYLEFFAQGPGPELTCY